MRRVLRMLILPTIITAILVMLLIDHLNDDLSYNANDDMGYNSCTSEEDYHSVILSNTGMKNILYESGIVLEKNQIAVVQNNPYNLKPRDYVRLGFTNLDGTYIFDDFMVSREIPSQPQLGIHEEAIFLSSTEMKSKFYNTNNIDGTIKMVIQYNVY